MYTKGAFSVEPSSIQLPLYGIVWRKSANFWNVTRCLFYLDTKAVKLK